MYSEHEIIILNENLPEYKIFKGDVGAIVAIYNNGEAFEVEFVTFSGVTVALVTLKNSQIRKINSNELMTTRELVF